jgi:hypothetical protein
MKVPIMANSLAKDLEIGFEEFVEGFDAACVLSKEVVTRFPDQVAMQRAGDTEYVSQEYSASVVTGLDISASTPSDVIDRKVPITYRTPDNVLWYLDAKEMRDPQYKAQMGKAAAKRLAAEVETNLYTNIVNRGGVFVKKVGAFTWDDAATAEALLLSRGNSGGMDRKLFLNPFDYKDVAKDLGNRAYIGDLSKAAYERSQIPNIAGFNSFRSDSLVNSVVTGTVTTVLVNGATQALTVAAMTGDLPQDNRQMVLNCDGANAAAVKAGDAFSLTGVNAVHNVTKADTGQLMTFRVISNAAGALTITPAIITTGPYQNVTASPADNLQLTFLNTATKPANVFWTEDACVLSYGKLAFPTGEGAQVMTATTKNGVPLLMSYAFNHLTGKTSCRYTTLYGTAVLQPEKCGIIVANQA